MLGEERVMAFDQPGTTRDSISTLMEHDGVRYELIDTAGVRRRSRVTDMVEKFSIIKALQAIDRAHVVVLMLDASEGHDRSGYHLAGPYPADAARALVIALNKWDGMTEYDRKQMLSEMDRRLQFVPWARKIRLSALHGSGLKELFTAVIEAWRSASIDMPTPELTRVLLKAFEAHQPPMSQGQRFTFEICPSVADIVHPRLSFMATAPMSYRLPTNVTWKTFSSVISNCAEHRCKSNSAVATNPFKDNKNTLTTRQMAKRKRLKKFTKGKAKK